MRVVGTPQRPRVLDLLEQAGAREGARVWLRGAVELTFAEALAAVDTFAARLRAAGAGPRDRVVLVAANHPEVVIAFLGALRAGAVPTILHESTRPRGLADVVAQTEPACLVLDPSTAWLRDTCPQIPTLLLTAGAHPDPDGGPAGSEVPVPDPVDPAFLVFTSGTTGSPRGVMVSHANVLFTTRAIQRRLGYRPEDVVGLFLPLSFDYGLYQVFLTLLSGAELYVAAPGQVPLGLVTALADHRVSVLPGVPQLTAALALMLDRDPSGLPALRAVTNTGERLPPGLRERLSALLPDVDVFAMYGLTECKRVSILLPGEDAEHPGSVGRPLDDTSVTILDPVGRPLPVGESGELAVTGQHVTMGYWRAPAETSQRFAGMPSGGRTLRTGDTCHLDRDGFLYFEGRLDEQRKRHGLRFSLLEVERVATCLPGVVAAAATQDGDSDELHLFVSVTTETVTVVEVMAALRDALEPHKVPDAIHVRAALPTTGHGKVDRVALRASLGGVR